MVQSDKSEANAVATVSTPPLTGDDIEALIGGESVNQHLFPMMGGAGENEDQEAEEEGQEESDPLHLGNLVAITSDKYGLVVGRIIFRDVALVRQIPQEASDRAIEYPMTPDGSGFDPELGVSEIDIIEEQSSDYFVDVLGARPGEVLEFFHTDGSEAAPHGEVAEVVKSTTKDAIVLVDGRTLRFRGVGPSSITDMAGGAKTPVEVIRVRASENIAAEETGLEMDEEQVEAKRKEAARIATEKARKSDILSLLRGVLPAATVETVPTAERSYPDALQREDLLQDLLADVPAKKRSNPRRIRFLEREVDLAMSLKNKSIRRDAAGRVLGTTKNVIDTIGDAIEVSTHPLPAAVPIVNAARVLNLDMLDTNLGYNPAHVFPRNLIEIENDSELISVMFSGDAAPGLTAPDRIETARSAINRGFYSYIYDLLGRDQQTLHATGATVGRGWQEDQEVIRTAGMSFPVQGLSTGLPNTIKTTAPSSLAFLMSDVGDRTMRVLSSDSFTYSKTGETVITGPSDPSDVSGYVILPIKAALSLRPPRRFGDLPTALIYSASLNNDNLPTLARTLADIYSEDTASPLHAWGIKTDAAADFSIAEWLKMVLRYAIHPADSLGPRTPRLLSILDSFGLGETDLSPDVNKVIWKWVKSSQKLWRSLLVDQRKRIQAALDAEPVRTFRNVAGEDSPLWSTGEGSLKTADILAEVNADIKLRNPSIYNSSSLLTASFLHDAQGDIVPLVSAAIAKIDSREAPISDEDALAALAASRAYALRRQAIQNIGLLSLKAEPEINTCKHVNDLEARRNVKDVLNRSKLMREFVEEYQGGRDGNWVTCAICKQHCVCYHELMELEALAQPTRMVAIQTQIRIQYGGDRYLGKIVCKNCGQPLSDIDFDEGMEFDDDGNPIMQRSVLTAEQMEEGENETELKKATMELLHKPDLEFVTASQKAIYEILQVILERGSLLADSEVIRQIVRYADLFVSVRAPPMAIYEAQRAKMLQSAATKTVPTYAAVLDQLRVTSLAALTTLALQAANPPMTVTSPLAICPFSREGWPLEEGAKPDQPGALQYITCAVATIQKDISPWQNLVWAGEPKLESRRKKVFSTTASAIELILKGDPKTGPLSFTNEINTMLYKARHDTEAKEARAKVSLLDQVPPGFRPDPKPMVVSRPAIEKNSVAEVYDAIQKEVPLEPMMEDITRAIHQQSLAVIGELHRDATAGIAPSLAQGPIETTDSVCCPATLSEVEAGILQGKPVLENLLKARKVLHQHNPSSTNAGTHLWPNFITPVPLPVEQNVEQGVYFKLFLKYCYSGSQIGEPHEFSFGNVCRQCGLSLGKPIDLVNFNTEGAAILAGQQGDLRIEVSQPAFEALSDAIRRRKTLQELGRGTRLSWMESLRTFLPAIKGDLAGALLSVLNSIPAEKEHLPLEEVSRAKLWSPISMYSDTLRQQITDRIGPAIPTQGGRASRARADETIMAMSTLESVVDDPFVEGPRVLQEYWCAKTEATGRGIAITNITGAKWSGISKDHNERINKMLMENSMWYAGTPLEENERAILRRVAETLGPMLRAWVQVVRPALSGPWTIEEARLVLQTMIFQVWADAVTTTSWMYASIAAPAEREKTAALLADWTRGLMYHTKQQFLRYSKENVRRILQQRAELERTSVVEEFENIKDDEQRAAELIKKQLKIGRWSKGANVRGAMDADLFEFENEQRRRMGIIDAPVDPIYLEGAGGPAAAAGQDFGFGIDNGAAEDGYFGMGADEDD
jgi:hypothetical protein